jgi:C-terminal processing protease CtpA/Prc
MFKTSLLTVVLVSSAIISHEVSAKTFDPFKNPPAAISQAVKDVYSGVKFNYLDKSDRLLILNDFLQTVELEYALLPLKKERIGLDFEKLKADAIAAENNIGDITLSSEDRSNVDLKDKTAFEQASSNLDFLDRMHALVAQFKDTHFSIQEKIAKPLIYTGVRLVRIQGKIIVGSLENKFLGMAGKLSGADFSNIKIGDEVISIDGIPVEDKINEMKKYVSASSDEFADSQAIRMLTIRSELYEKKNYIKLELKSAGILKLPIFANIPNGSTLRLDAMTYFKKMEIPTDTASIGMIFDKTLNKWSDSGLTFEGYSTRKLHLNLKGLTEYSDDTGAPGLRTGYYINKGKTYGVLQILTFYTTNLKTGNTTLPYIDAIRNFVLEMKDNELPLIIDLRVNGGGNGSFPALVLSLLTEDGVIYPGATSGFRMTEYMRQVQEPGLYQQVVGEDQSEGLTMEQLKDLIDNTLANHLDYTPMFTTEVIPYDSKVKGFSNKIVALVTADCISACDKMAFLLKSSKRATIIGTHSNGTGAGFLSTEALDTQWVDKLRVISTQVPNYLFGIPGGDFDQVAFGDGSVSKLCSENRPTMADVQYSPTPVDVMRNSLGWLQKAAQVLDGLDSATK